MNIAWVTLECAGQSHVQRCLPPAAVAFYAHWLLAPKGHRDSPFHSLGKMASMYWLVMVIVAGVKASEGVGYRYPMSLRLVK